MPKINRKISTIMYYRKRCKIIKKIAEHRRKVRKEANKNPHERTKDTGVLNSFQFEEELLHEAEQRKQTALDLKENQKASRLKIQMENRGVKELAEEAGRNDAAFEDIPRAYKENQLKENEPNFKTSFKELKNVIENSDIVLEVLDSRDPLKNRCPQIEELVISSGKKLILVLNKIDLIPKKNLKDWLIYLRKSLPTVAFKASTQSSSPCFGAKFLMKTLINYWGIKKIQTFLKVGVVGFPNVGKNSVINSLKQCRAWRKVESNPEGKEDVQIILMDKYIKIIDSPGVVLARSDSSANLAVRDADKDVIISAIEIMKRVDPKYLFYHYKIPECETFMTLFGLLAKKMGKYKENVVKSAVEGAKGLINDWNHGVINYYTEPPDEDLQTAYLSTTVVSDFANAFNISAWEEKILLDKFPINFPINGIRAISSGTTNIDISANDEEEIELKQPEKKVIEKLEMQPNVIAEEEEQNKIIQVLVQFELEEETNLEKEPEVIVEEEQQNKLAEQKNVTVQFDKKKEQNLEKDPKVIAKEAYQNKLAQLKNVTFFIFDKKREEKNLEKEPEFFVKEGQQIKLSNLKTVTPPFEEGVEPMFLVRIEGKCQLMKLKDITVPFDKENEEKNLDTETMEEQQNKLVEKECTQMNENHID